MDIIDGKSHEPLKEAMRALMQDQLSETQCDITCLTSQGEKLELTCDILPALYEGERCMQLMLRSVMKRITPVRRQLRDCRENSVPTQFVTWIK